MASLKSMETGAGLLNFSSLILQGAKHAPLPVKLLGRQGNQTLEGALHLAESSSQC